MSKTKIDWLGHLKSILYIITLVIIIRGVGFELFHVPSGSMKETLLTEDHIFVTKFSYGIGPYSAIVPIPISKRIFFSQPKRGDIIVFRSPYDDDPKGRYIKRLIGLPGDKIQMIDRILYINDKPVNLIPDGEFDDKDLNKKYQRFIEENPEGVRYHVLYDLNCPEEEFPNTTGIYQVPQGYYFFMGDNRNNSIDSRFLKNIGYIQDIRLLGKAQYLLWNGGTFKNIFTLFPGDRKFMRLH